MQLAFIILTDLLGKIMIKIVIRNHMISVNNFDFYGTAHISPNKRWVVGCRDSDGARRGGLRESGNGRVILVNLDENRIVLDVNSLARPSNAAVSDTGQYIIYDAGFGSKLGGDVIAFSSGGEELYRRIYQANVYSIGLSPCGRYGVVQTANAPNPDGNLLELFDIAMSLALFSMAPSSGWADKYSFKLGGDGSISRLFVHLKDFGRFAYSAEGQFLDEKAFGEAQLKKGNYSNKLLAAQRLINTRPTREIALTVISVADIALAEGAGERPDWSSVAYRIRGEGFEILGDLSRALESFETAMNLNQKSGVKKRIASLQKRLQQ